MAAQGLTLTSPEFVPDGIIPSSVTHWVLFNIPASADGLVAGASGVGVNGRNDFEHIGYGGPCPPANHGEHRYFFKLFALDVTSLNLPEGSSRDEVENAIEDHVIDKTELMGRYERNAG